MFGLLVEPVLASGARRFASLVSLLTACFALFASTFAMTLRYSARVTMPSPSLSASFQRAIVNQLVRKLERAAGSGEWPAIALGGGVAANAALRRRTEALCDELGLKLKLVPISLCTDNAAMIAVPTMRPAR